MIDAGVSMSNFRGFNGFFSFFLALLSIPVGGGWTIRSLFYVAGGSFKPCQRLWSFYGSLKLDLGSHRFDVELRQRDEMTCKMGTAIMWTHSE